MAIGQGRCGRFIYDTENFQAGNFTSIFGSLALGISEIGWNSDNSLSDGLTQISFGVGF
jgi:hypothetical protein